MQVLSLSQEDPLREGMATHSSILAWRIPWTGWLQSMGSQRIRRQWAQCGRGKCLLFSPVLFFCFSKHLISENLPSAHSFVFTVFCWKAPSVSLYLLQTTFLKMTYSSKSTFGTGFLLSWLMSDSLPQCLHLFLSLKLEILNIKDVLNVTPSILCHAIFSKQFLLFQTSFSCSLLWGWL